MNVSIQRMLSFWARTAPKTPMQRIGALLMAFVSILSSVVVLMTIATAFVGSWSIVGIASSVFGFALILWLLPIGIAHGFAAILPQVLDAWKHAPKNQAEEMRARIEDQINEMYLAVGWFASLVVIALLVYLLLIRSV